VIIPSDVEEVGVFLYDPKSKERKPIEKKYLKKKAIDLLERFPNPIPWSLIVLKRRDDMTNDKLPFYIKRKGDLWEVKINHYEMSW
jgi:hypothetical protein